MKIVQVHNYYQIKGGESIVVSAEKKMLEDNGHEVVTFYKHNSSIHDYSIMDKFKLFKESTWSKTIYIEFTKFLKLNKPDVCHIHNTLPLISPSVFTACYTENIPVVLTLHNYRLICTNGLLLRNGVICEECIGKSAFSSVLKKCYRKSMLQTYSVANMIEKNWRSGVWEKQIDKFICLTEFAKSKFIQHGFESDKIVVKGNFVNPNIDEKENVRPYFLYVGRLEENKGLKLLTMIKNELRIPIKLIGKGDLFKELSGYANLELLGEKNHEETLKYIKNSFGLIMPTIGYEGGFPLTILEAFAAKTPTISSNIGAMSTLIKHKGNGLLFEPRSANGLLDCLNYVLDNKMETEKITNEAFKNYKKLYSIEANYKKLIEIYTTVIKNR